ncbi:unnamed protein product [Leuciscus chuanchicus]
MTSAVHPLVSSHWCLARSESPGLQLDASRSRRSQLCRHLAAILGQETALLLPAAVDGSHLALLLLQVVNTRLMATPFCDSSYGQSPLIGFKSSAPHRNTTLIP